MLINKKMSTLVPGQLASIKNEEVKQEKFKIKKVGKNMKKAISPMAKISKGLFDFNARPIK